MRVVVDFDPEAIRRNWARSKSAKDVAFVIYLVHDSTEYPGANWNDFGLSVLGQWLSALIGLWGGTDSTAELWFLDGPYKLRATLHGDRRTVSLTAERGAVSWTVSLLELTEEVIRACEDTCRRLRELGVDDCVVSPLESGSARLSQIMRS
jgi:hypothetical protein